MLSIFTLYLACFRITLAKQNHFFSSPISSVYNLYPTEVSREVKISFKIAIRNWRFNRGIKDINDVNSLTNKGWLFSSPQAKVQRWRPPKQCSRSLISILGDIWQKGFYFYII